MAFRGEQKAIQTVRQTDEELRGLSLLIRLILIRLIACTVWGIKLAPLLFCSAIT